MTRRTAAAGVTLRRAELGAVTAALAFILILAVGVAWAGGREVLAELGRIGLQGFLGLLGLSMVNYVARGVRWHAFSRHLGLPVPAWRSGLYYVAGFGEALRLWLLQRCHGCRYERTAALMVGDRLSDMSALLVLCMLGLGAFAGYTWITLAVVAVGGLVWLLLRPSPLLRLVLLAYRRLGRWPRSFARLRVLIRETAKLMNVTIFGTALVLATIGWLAEGFALHVLLGLLGVDHVTLQAAIFVFAFSTLAGAVTMLPGGLGGAEATMVALLLALGVTADAAVAATVVFRVATLWFAVGLGFLVLPHTLRLAHLGSVPPSVTASHRPPRG
jgi:uncharacterized membrane protein YbhN (UPF0104 family)